MDEREKFFVSYKMPHLARKHVRKEKNSKWPPPFAKPEGSGLWDVLRMIPITRKKALALSPYVTDIDEFFDSGAGFGHRSGSVIRCGKLFDPKYAVKVGKITKDFNEVEKVIPPQFKTLESPLSSRAKRQGADGKRARFGVRRITRNYIRDKRKKYCPPARVGLP